MRKLPETMDLHDMGSMVSHFPFMLSNSKQSPDLYAACKNYYEEGIEGICFLGMGGSSIIGLYVSEILSQESRIPIKNVRTYFLPKWITKGWIIIAVSYSGNTEETLSSLKQAKERGSRVVSITSGGQMAKESSSLSPVLIQAGIQPRAAFPLLFSQVLPISELLIGSSITDLDKISDYLITVSSKWGEWIPTPSIIAEKVQNRIPLFIGAQHLSPVAYRAKCQFNENSKVVAFFSEVPEASHNEIEGFPNRLESPIIPIFLRTNNEITQIKRKMDVMMKLYSEIGLNPINLNAAGNSKIENMLSLTHYLDTVSVHLAIRRGVDAVSVERISELKKRLASKG